MMQCQGKVSGALAKIPFVNLNLYFEIGLILLPSKSSVITPASTISRLAFCNHVFTPNIAIMPPLGGGGARQLSLHVCYKTGQF